MTASHHGNLWRASSEEAISVGPLDTDLTVDLAVIGGGFSGSSAALEAARRGASVALLEAQTIGHGGSGRNVGLANAGLWLKPDEILAETGEEAGRALIARLGAAPDLVYGLIAREEISCEATRNGTLHCAHAPSGMEDLRARFRQGNAMARRCSCSTPPRRRRGSAARRCMARSSIRAPARCSRWPIAGGWRGRRSARARGSMSRAR